MKKKEERKVEESSERERDMGNREGGRHWHKGTNTWRPATYQLAVSPYNSQHLYSVLLALGLFGSFHGYQKGWSDTPSTSTHMHTTLWTRWLHPFAMLLFSSVLSSVPFTRAELWHPSKDAWLGTPRLTLCFALCFVCLVFVVCFYLLHSLQMGPVL